MGHLSPQISPSGSILSEKRSLSVSQLKKRPNEDEGLSQRAYPDTSSPIRRSSSIILPSNIPFSSRGGSLKKSSSRRGSIKKYSSRKSSRAGSMRSLLQTNKDIDENNSIFYSPVPTKGNPTELLAYRFKTAWRKFLKNLITCFREIQASYDHRKKSLLKISNILKNTIVPPGFLKYGGIHDATLILKKYHRKSSTDAKKFKDIENDVILALVELRSDLKQKIKEIKNLSGDFKNCLEKRMESTYRTFNEFHESLGLTDIDSTHFKGRPDPYLLKLATDHMIKKQITEENYLHQAYLNLEISGRKLDAIIVGEIQKSYLAYATILRREAEIAKDTFENLHNGPIFMPKDQEWSHFLKESEDFVDPEVPIRQSKNIKYLGMDDELVQEVRVGVLERKSKHLNSYTTGWYVLTQTHLHEFNSADKSQAPVISLNISEQKLRLPSIPDSTSNTFMLKGRQTGVMMHRECSWVFRCESHETMISWYEALKNLIEDSSQERNKYFPKFSRSSNAISQIANSIGGSDGAVEDEEPSCCEILVLATRDSTED
ncbi:Phosphatidylinositol 4,5-bisphosphate-binding protein SLM1 [Golovinomyces cichoracearum]|uniref:Phosphatidylinositol 4,5-bisphosphate-binding protein SLM1 n=1 Tax=Golovinomyces cichoracearum TaxID=62708 RepID=A0A420JA26_9PEZI|nr:Phosphatidylinositol 4,5-bisphosphate-binding protein SLM1 [Golovinomyces cichoracearum]